MARIKHHYSKKEKLDILKQLKANDFNKHGTSKKLGVSIPSLNRWMEEFGDQLAEIEPQEARVNALIPLEDEMSKRYEEYVLEALDVRIELLQKIKLDIHKIRSPLIATNILKIIDESILNNIKAVDPEHKDSKPGKSLSLIYQQIYNEATN